MLSALMLRETIHPWAETPWGAGLVLFGLFALGSLLGSFANVVVYRLPRRRSLLWPPSYCPRCKHPIRWRDNVPILGWLLLDGKCRDCGRPISSQYVFVETLFGILVATLGWLEGIEGQANLPFREHLLHDDIPPSQWIFVANHVLLIGTLICAALMQYDGKPISRSILVFAGWWGLALPLVWSAMRPVPLGQVLPEMLRVSSAMLAIVEGAAGLVAGVMAGLLIWPATPQGRAPRDRQVDALYELGMIGTFVGWQAVCGIAAVTLALHWVNQLVGLRVPAANRLNWAVWLAGVTFVWVCFWSTIVRVAPFCGKSADAAVLIVAWLVLAAASPLVRLTVHRTSEQLAATLPAAAQE